MIHILNSLKGVIQGTTTGVTKGDTRSLDYGSYDRKLSSLWSSGRLLIDVGLGASGFTKLCLRLCELQKKTHTHVLTLY